MMTLFTTAKPFRGHSAIIQRNAIQSWIRLRPKCEVVLFGDEEGTAEIAGEFGLCHIPDVARNEYGTPLLSAMFDTAQQVASHSILCYVNADIILMSDFMQAVEQVVHHKRCFLMVGQRWDVNLNQSWDFSRPDWESRMREYVRTRGSLHPPYGIDYFVFPHGLWGDIPPFAIARTAFDNWLIYAARNRGAAVIDATRAVMAVHQNHAHVFEGTKWVGTREYPEAKRNLEIAGGYRYAFTLQDATHILTSKGPKLDLSHRRLSRHLHTLPILFPQFRPLAMLVMPLVRVSRPLRLRLRLIVGLTRHKK